MGLRVNPFSSQFVEPARGGYLFEDPGAFAAVMADLRASNWRGELVGVHGAGKSTLLTDILHHLQEEGYVVAPWQVRSDSRLFPAGWWGSLRGARVLAIDGAEALAPGLLWAARLITRLRGKGLLITAHRQMGMPASIPVSPNPVALSRKITALMSGTGNPLPGANEHVAEITHRLNAHRGNAREVLFDLYMEAEDTVAVGCAEKRD